MTYRPSKYARPDAKDEPYFVGYREATKACANGSVDSAWVALERPHDRGAGYLIGYRYAVWHFERATGLAATNPPPIAYGNAVTARSLSRAAPPTG